MIKSEVSFNWNIRFWLKPDLFGGTQTSTRHRGNNSVIKKSTFRQIKSLWTRGGKKQRLARNPGRNDDVRGCVKGVLVVQSRAVPLSPGVCRLSRAFRSLHLDQVLQPVSTTSLKNHWVVCSHWTEKRWTWRWPFANRVVKSIFCSSS